MTVAQAATLSGPIAVCLVNKLDDILVADLLVKADLERAKRLVQH